MNQIGLGDLVEEDLTTGEGDVEENVSVGYDFFSHQFSHTIRHSLSLSLSCKLDQQGQGFRGRTPLD